MGFHILGVQVITLSETLCKVELLASQCSSPRLWLYFYTSVTDSLFWLHPVPVKVNPKIISRNNQGEAEISRIHELHWLRHITLSLNISSVEGSRGSLLCNLIEPTGNNLQVRIFISFWSHQGPTIMIHLLTITSFREHRTAGKLICEYAPVMNKRPYKYTSE